MEKATHMPRELKVRLTRIGKRGATSFRTKSKHARVSLGERKEAAVGLFVLREL
jgi:hypothetical protein